MATNEKNTAVEAETETMEALERDNVPATEGEDEEESLILTLKKPYKFEGKTYTEVDLSALEDTNGADMAAVNKILSRKGVVTPMPEMTLDFCIYMAARISGLPAEFFLGLPSRDTIGLKNLVTGFLYGGDGED